MIGKIKFYMHHPETLINSIYYKMRMAHFGSKSFILKPMSIDNPKGIFIGNRVLIQQYVWLAACSYNKEKAELIISDGVRLGHFNHIYSTKKIIIEKAVLTADRVYIGDIKHSYSDVNQFIINQKIVNVGTVTIGEGTWIGENACIIGANIGKHCVIGANSVVTHDIPDYCVAVGSPAKVVKSYNFQKKCWESRA